MGSVEHSAVDLTATFGEIELHTPLLGASGCFGYGKEYADFVDLRRLGGVVSKGISLQPRSGNPPPRIFETAAGMLNSIGLANIGARAFLDSRLDELASTGTSVWVNFFGETFEEYVECAEILGHESAGRISALEMNVSCPNVARGGIEFGTCPETIHRLTRACTEVAGVPVVVKLTPNVSNIVEIAQAASEGGAHGVSAINTVTGMAIDVRARRPVLSTTFGGLSGPAIKPIGLAAVYRIHRALPQLPICGIGGVWEAADVVEYLLAGASCVQVGTLNFTNPAALPELTGDLSRLLADLGFTSSREAVGAAHVR